jgi:hypothetical protein
MLLFVVQKSVERCSPGKTSIFIDTIPFVVLINVQIAEKYVSWLICFLVN